MTARKKQKAVSKKPKEVAREGKTSGKRSGSGPSGKAMTPRGSGVKKAATGRTATAAKPAGKKATAKKTPLKTQSGTKTNAVTRAKPEGRPGGLQELKKTLLRKREAIVREAKEEIAKYISGENRQLVDTALDEGDWAVVDISEDINLMRLAAHRKSMHDIDESLRKISEGSYGICEECGGEIGEKRLSVLPAATLCVNCQGNKERLEAIEREEPSV